MAIHELPATATTGLFSLGAILRTRLLFGFYCSVGTRVTRFFSWLYCLCIAHILITIFIIGVKGRLFLLPVILEYSCNVFISLLMGDNQFIDYLRRTELMDREMGHDLPLTTKVARIMFLIIVSEKTLLWLGSVLFWNYPIGSFTITFSTLVVALNLNQLGILLPLDILRLRLQLLRQSLQINLEHHRSSPSNVNNQIKILQNSLRLYKRLLDNFHSTFNWSKLRIAIGFTSCFCGYVASSHEILKMYTVPDHETLLSKGSAGWFFNVLDLLFDSSLPCVSALLIELISRECDQLKVTVGNLLLLCDDSPLRDELELAAEYLELRPFSVSILRVFKLNGAFVLSFVSLCVSWLIVMIQFTGL